MTPLILLLLMADPTLIVVGKWHPGLIESHTYKLGEVGIPGSSTYSLRGMLRHGQKVLEVEVETHRVLTLGGQQGKLESRTLTWMDPQTFDMLETRLTTTMNGTEASYLHAVRKGGKIEVFQKLRGSPPDTRQVEAPGVAIDENALNFFITRLPWSAGRQFEWSRYSAAQSRVVPYKATLEKSDKQTMRVKVETDIAPSFFDIRKDKMPVVERVEIGGTEQMKLTDEPKQP